MLQPVKTVKKLVKLGTTDLRMPAAVFIGNFSKVAETNNYVQTSFTRFSILVNVTIKAVALSVFDRKFSST